MLPERILRYAYEYIRNNGPSSARTIVDSMTDESTRVPRPTDLSISLKNDRRFKAAGVTNVQYTGGATDVALWDINEKEEE